MGQASRSLSDFEKAQQGMGGAATTTMGRLVQSAKANEAEWSTVGRTLLGVGGAMAAIGGAALKTGIEYNTLQQTSRKALTTIMGGAEAANAQMDKLDAFATTSPFAKQVFITAQQQMLGFGVEAKKVIPYLDAIQNAVAATGGSNQDIAELANVFSKVQANAKITARELMEFGIRGVDAATIIGAQMGKTGAEIRDEITKGTLDAGEALDALAAGMQDSFGGAAAGVKETIEGAFDRVKAAWRDIGSALASPLVDPEGGGALIGWLNTLADGMRKVEGTFKAAPDWLKAGTLGFGALATAVTLGAGTFMLALPRYIALREALTKLAAVHPKMATLTTGVGKFAATAGKVALWGTAALIAAKGLTAIVESSRPAAAGINEIELALRRTDIDAAFGHLTGSYNSLDQAWRTLTSSSPVDWIDRQLSALNQAIGGPFPDDVKGAADGFVALGGALAQMHAAGDAEGAAAQFDLIANALGLTGDEIETLLGLMPAYKDALAGAEVETARAADGMSDLADGTDDVAEAMAAADEVMQKWRQTLQGAAQSFTGALSAYDAVIEKNREIAQSTADATSSTKDSWEDFYDGTTVSMKDWIKELEAQAEAVRNWRTNYSDAMRQIADEVDSTAQEAHRAFVDELYAAGEGGAAALATFVDGTPAERARLVEAWVGAGEEMVASVEAGLKPIPMDLDTSRAISEAGALMGDWESTTTTTNLDMDGAEADREFARIVDNWERTSTDTRLGANTSSADGTFRTTTNKWASELTTTNLGLNTSAATSTLNTWKANNSSFTVWANVQTRGGVNPGSMIGKYHGGKITTPGLASGGKVPGPRASHDNVLWPLAFGGRTLDQPLSGGEWVINSRQAAANDGILAAINAGNGPLSLSLSDADVARIAAAVRAGSAAGVGDGFAGVSAGVRLSGVVV